ncbi:unnamed protein product [Dibothriocephalus latus]|uniref:Protein kinase domain-containing protein n=1 Tax=Dibothriocephalus latus TaxID=60516 RepID=A0A3P6T4L9_DIBLA|nr:unnamed protein product [Dibothriocephalus latus]
MSLKNMILQKRKLVLYVWLFPVFLRPEGRRDFPKGKHPFIISLNRASGGGQIRLLNGSLQDTSLAATKTTSLSGTGGAPMDLSTFEPIWNQELNSLYGNVLPENGELYQDMHIPASRIRFLHYIGCGAFGKVWEGCLQTTDADGNIQYQKVALKVRFLTNTLLYEFKCLVWCIRCVIQVKRFEQPEETRITVSCLITNICRVALGTFTSDYQIGVRKVCQYHLSIT